jgi:hypothetical protein
MFTSLHRYRLCSTMIYPTFMKDNDLTIALTVGLVGEILLMTVMVGVNTVH